MNKKEYWKDIPMYIGYYQISNLGNIRSLDRVVKDTTKERTQKIKGKIIKQTNNGKGYLIVGLIKNNKRKNYYVHRLVAENFIDNPNNYKEVNHIDLDKSNNCVENLEWVTQQQNKEHFRKSNKVTLFYQKLRETNKKKREEKINQYTKIIVEKYTKENKTFKDISQELHIGTSYINDILKLNNIPINRKPRVNFKLLRDSKGRFVKKVF